MARITDEQYQKMVEDSYRTHVLTRLRAKYKTIAQDANDDELIQVWHRLNIPDASPEEAQGVLDKLYGDDWEPPTRPAPSFMERAGDVARGTGELAKGVAQGLTEFGGAAAAGAVAKSSPVAQAAMAVPTAIRAAGRQIAGQSLEKTAADMPAPNLMDLASRGYSEKQIHAIMKGYTDTQHSLMSDVEEMGKGGVTEASMGIANALFMNPRSGWLSSLTQNAIKGAEKKGAGAAVQGAIEHGIGGAIWGGAYGATQGGVEAGAQAVAEGKGADEVLGAVTAGALAAGKMGVAAGALLGGGLGAISGAAGAHATASAERKAAAARAVTDAQNAQLKNFGESFQPQWLSERFPDLLAKADPSGATDEQLATEIVSKVWGDVANTEAGMRAASMVLEKIRAWRNINMGLAGPMLDLPQRPVGPEQIPNIAQPVGAPIEPTMGGQAPVPGVADMGPIGQRTPGFVPPEGAPNMVGLQVRPPLSTQQQVPMQLEGVAPMEPAPAAARLSQPLGADVTPNRVSSALPNPEPVERLPFDPGVTPTVTGRSAVPAENALSLTRPPVQGLVSPEAPPIEPRNLELPGETPRLPAPSPERPVGMVEGARPVLTPENAPAAVQGPYPTPSRGFTPPTEPVGRMADLAGPMHVEVPKAVADDVAKAVETESTPVAKDLAKPRPAPTPGKAHQLDLFADTNIAAAKERIKKRGIRLNTFIDPADVADVAIIGANYLLKGAVQFTQWSKAMVDEFGDMVKPHLARLYQESLALYNSRRPAGNDDVRRISENYLRSVGLGGGHVPGYEPIQPQFARRIAKAYNSMPDVPRTKKERLATKNSYKALAMEVDQQFKAIEDAGIKIEFVKDDPYASSADMMKDVRENRRLRVFLSDGDPHPYLTAEQNNKFRAVHDFFGHAAEGYEFGPRGEDNAWRKHAVMFSNTAIPAMTTETRGQNSWVNFSPGHEAMSPRERPFAKQKAGLLPEWVYEEVITPRKKRPQPRLGQGTGMSPNAREGAGVEEAARSLARGVRPTRAPEMQYSRGVADGVAAIPEHLAGKPDAAEWYAKSIEKMEKNTELEYPDMKDKPERMTLFKLLLAITSPQTPVPLNYARGTILYDGFLKTGTIPLLARQGQEINITSRSTVPKINAILKRHNGDLKAVATYLTSKNAKGVYNAVKEFGPKVGRFFLNLNGIHDESTIDVWMARWWRRVNGTLYETVDGKRQLRGDKVDKSEMTLIRKAMSDIAKQLGIDESTVQSALWDREKSIWSSAGLDSPNYDFAWSAERINSMRNQRTAEGAKALEPPQQTSLF